MGAISGGLRTGSEEESGRGNLWGPVFRQKWDLFVGRPFLLRELPSLRFETEGKGNLYWGTERKHRD